jgi:hypothetical protein
MLENKLVFVSVSTARDKAVVRAKRKFRLNCGLQCAAHDFFSISRIVVSAFLVLLQMLRVDLSGYKSWPFSVKE